MELRHVHHLTFDKLICAISIICLAVVLVLVLVLKDIFQSLSLGSGPCPYGSSPCPCPWGSGPCPGPWGSGPCPCGSVPCPCPGPWGQVLVLVLGGQVLVLVLVLGGQVLVNIPELSSPSLARKVPERVFRCVPPTKVLLVFHMCQPQSI